MTFEPPPPPGSVPPPSGEQDQWAPPPAPPGYGAPPPAQPQGAWGPPQGSPYPAPRSTFDPKTVNPLDWGILGAGLLAFIFSFIDFYTAGVDLSGTCFGHQGGT